MEFTGLGPKKENQVCFAGYLGYYLCDLLYVFDTVIWFYETCFMFIWTNVNFIFRGSM